jgi:fido (protein-threonine AMPylation protein)
VERTAYYLDHFNYVHPFLEGDGRTLQAVLLQMSY